MGPVFQKLTEIQDRVANAQSAATLKKTNSPEWVEKERAEAEYKEFKNDLARDFRVMMACAAEQQVTLDELSHAVIELLIGRFDFDSISAMANDAKVSVLKAKHEAEDMRKEMDELRRQIELIRAEQNQKAHRRAG